MSSYNRLISVYSTQLSWIQRLWTVWECRSSTNLRPISNQAQYNIMIPRLWTAVGYRHLDRDGWGVFYPTVQPVRGAKGTLTNFSFLMRRSFSSPYWIVYSMYSLFACSSLVGTCSPSLNLGFLEVDSAVICPPEVL